MKVIKKSDFNKLPLRPGVYLFLDKKDNVLYVGRAISLRKRVSNYFQKYLEPRILEMKNLASKIRHQTTDTILEAVILEANLIKKYWPKYNIRERDNRSFVYIAIPQKDFAKPIVVRGRELKKFPLKKNQIFGPYKSQSIVFNALKIIRRIFPYSNCKINSGRPCFDYQINLCPGACLGIISKKDYQKNIDNMILLLKGRKRELLKKLSEENPQKAQALKHIQDVALISREDNDGIILNRIEGYDISHFSGKNAYGSMVVFANGEPQKSDYRLFKIKNAPQSDDLRALEEIVLRRLKHQEWRLPDLILIDGGKPQIDFLTKSFQKYNVKIPFLGVSKYQDDKLIFPKDAKNSFKELAQSIRETLLKVREESHRFAIKFSRKK